MTETTPTSPDAARDAAASARAATALDRVADAYVDALTQLDPFTATSLGVPGREHEVPDYSPAGWDAQADLTRRTLEEIAATEDEDAVDAITRAAMQERLGLDLAMDEAGLTRSAVNNIHSVLQSQGVFDMMATETDEDWQAIADRLAKFPGLLEGWALTLRTEAGKGHIAARRQLELGAAQARDYAEEETGYFAHLLKKAPADSPVRPAVEAGIAGARSAYRKIADVLESLMPEAPASDAVGREAYALASRQYLGTEIDIEETYAWGIEHLRGIIAEQEQVAARINEHYGTGKGADIAAARAALDADPERTLHGTDALRAWMQELSDQAVAELSGTHFDIPAPLHRLECRIAETGSGGIYYTGPSEDLTRPGRMWWDVPHGVTEFHTWAETTTVYHEGVPGHHLQVGIQTMQAERLNRWRAMMCWVSGHGEGWALYAERLMDQLGYLADDGDRLGMLDAQRMRAGRVVLDIGLHNELPMPSGLPGSAGGEWTYEKAWDFMTENWGVEEGQRRFELHRYLGWPGQAPSYKLGQREWERLRDAALAAAEGQDEGAALRDFHRRALELGSLPLSVLADALGQDA